MLCRQHRTRANADGHPPAMGRQRMHDGLPLDQALAALGHLLRGFGVGFGQQHHKLLATVARHQVTLSIQRQAQGLSNIHQAFVSLDMTVQIVVLLEEVDIEQQHGQGLAIAARALPLLLEAGIEAASVGNAGQTILEGEHLQLLLQTQQPFLGLFAFADVEHEADQRLSLTLLVAHHMDHIANPDIAVVLGQRAIVSLMVHAGLGLAHTEIHHIFAVVGVHAHGPVFDADPAFTAPAKQAFDLRTDIGELHGRPVDLPGNGLGGLQQGSIDRTLALKLAHIRHKPSLSRSQSIKQQARLWFRPRPGPSDSLQSCTP
ncbi:hypothetical protein SDC9_136655 [bioreactor metagenome]|uniref:Uncharacterized protein n=1 Tax=bioreactor metagenome TaxID=1076179 RepID=A0A645DJR3_9ZZZZ